MDRATKEFVVLLAVVGVEMGWLFLWKIIVSAYPEIATPLLLLFFSIIILKTKVFRKGEEIE